MKGKVNTSKKGRIVTKKKAAKTIKSTGDFLAENKKEILYVSVAALALYLVYKGVKGASSGLEEALEDKSESVPIDLDLTTKTTISKKDAQKYAQQLLDACNEEAPFYGTDEVTIKQVFQKLKTPGDFKLVFSVFGKKNYNGYGSPPVGVWRHLDNYAPRDLVYWLKSEIKESDGAVYKIVKDRIESANWNF